MSSLMVIMMIIYLYMLLILKMSVYFVYQIMNFMVLFLMDFSNFSGEGIYIYVVFFFNWKEFILFEMYISLGVIILLMFLLSGFLKKIVLFFINMYMYINKKK